VGAHKNSEKKMENNMKHEIQTIWIGAYIGACVAQGIPINDRNTGEYASLVGKNIFQFGRTNI
jgi:hypothetical protein